MPVEGILGFAMGMSVSIVTAKESLVSKALIFSLLHNEILT